MRVSLFSNSPWVGSGYGQQAALLLPKLLDRYGHGNVASISNYGLQGSPMTLAGVRHYPTGLTAYSDDIGPLHARHFLQGQRGLTITLFDVWPLQNPAWAGLPSLAAWVPVDHDPVPPGVVAFFAAHGATPIAMSQWGAERLRVDAGLDPLYVPHGIDTDEMVPVDRDRARHGLPDGVFVAGMVAANKGTIPCRKSFPEVFQAWRIFHARHPESKLFMWTDLNGNAGGLNLPRLAAGIGVDPESIMWVDPYAYHLGLDMAGMARMMSCFDVLVAPSMGEGFGIPVIEAQSCGVPVIVSDFSAQPELCANGWVVGGTRWFDAAQDSYLFTPAVELIVDALEAAYERTGTPAAAAAAAAGRQFVVDNYEVDTVWERHWMPVLDELEARLADPVAPIVADPVRSLS